MSVNRKLQLVTDRGDSKRGRPQARPEEPCAQAAATRRLLYSVGVKPDPLLGAFNRLLAQVDLEIRWALAFD